MFFPCPFVAPSLPFQDGGAIPLSSPFPPLRFPLWAPRVLPAFAPPSLLPGTVPRIPYIRDQDLGGYTRRLAKKVPRPGALGIVVYRLRELRLSDLHSLARVGYCKSRAWPPSRRGSGAFYWCQETRQIPSIPGGYWEVFLAWPGLGSVGGCVILVMRVMLVIVGNL